MAAVRERSKVLEKPVISMKGVLGRADTINSLGGRLLHSQNRQGARKHGDCRLNNPMEYRFLVDFVTAVEEAKNVIDTLGPYNSTLIVV